MYMNNIPVNKRYLAYLASFSHLATLRQVFEFICMRLRLRLEETRLWLYKDDVSNVFIKVFVTYIFHFEFNRNVYFFTYIDIILKLICDPVILQIFFVIKY